MRVLVTGHAGYIGRHLVPELLARGHDVDGLDLVDGLDVRTDPLPPADVVVHLAALKSARECATAPLDYHDTNVVGTLRVVQAGMPVVFASSAAVHGGSVYGFTKAAGERIGLDAAAAHGTPFVALRLYNVVGGVMDHDDPGIVPSLLRAKRYGTAATLYGNALRDYIDVHEVAAIIADHAEAPCTGVHEVGTGKATPTVYLADIVGLDPVLAPSRPGEQPVSVAPEPYGTHRPLADTIAAASIA